MSSSLSPRAVRILLADWQAAGLTHLFREERGEAGGSTAGDESPVSHGPEASAFHSQPAETATSESEVDLKKGRRPQGRAARELALQQLDTCVKGCTRCQELASTRTQTVFGVGNPEARVMFIGEAPGADEDAQGEPFVGRAGQLLNKIIAACGWTREDLYICNILRCRPPGNRTPLPQEAANCREYLDGQISIVDPDYIVCWGSCAAQNLLGMTDAIGKMRQKWFQYGRAKVLCTYHPSYLLRNPEAKKPVWDDMQLLMAEMGVTPPKG
jgi:DNA polymerase